MTDEGRAGDESDRPARCPGPGYQDILDGDAHPAPPILREEADTPNETREWPTDVYTSREYAEREADLLWRRVWHSPGSSANPSLMIKLKYFQKQRPSI